MFANRFILNPRNLLSKKALPLRGVGEAVRENHIVSVPPRVKVSPTRNIVSGIVLAFSMFAIPTWILYYLPEYQGVDRHSYTGK